MYEGLPNFLRPQGVGNFTSGADRLTPLESELEGVAADADKLLAVYSGTELRNAHLDVRTSLLTVVYYATAFVHGFNATVTVGDGPGEGKWAFQGETQQEEEVSKTHCDLCTFTVTVAPLHFYYLHFYCDLCTLI